MKANNVFTTITLQNGSKCQILEITARGLWRAQWKFSFRKNEEIPVAAFLWEEMLLIDGKKVNVEEIGNLSIDDYTSIGEVIETSLKKII